MSRHATTRLGWTLSTILLAAACALWLPPASAQALAPQSSDDNGVTVTVTPKTTVAGGAKEWEFAVALNTHSQDLSDDLTQSAVLVLDDAQVKPSHWTGAAAGGHHREGTLSFPAPSQAPKTVELRIQRAGEAAPRVFRWNAAP